VLSILKRILNVSFVFFYSLFADDVVVRFGKLVLRWKGRERGWNPSCRLTVLGCWSSSIGA